MTPELVYPVQILDEIATCARGRAMYDSLLIETIQKARDFNVSWSRIGEALGVSRQAATERYKPHMTNGRVEKYKVWDE